MTQGTIRGNSKVSYDEPGSSPGELNSQLRRLEVQSGELECQFQRLDIQLQELERQFCATRNSVGANRGFVAIDTGYWYPNLRSRRIHLRRRVQLKLASSQRGSPVWRKPSDTSERQLTFKLIVYMSGVS